MTFKVRDEEDVLEANLRYHLARGVDFFVVTDNGSIDGTRALLGRYERAGLAQVIDEPGVRMIDHAERWLTRMARLAADEHGADWILHNDADEFWWPLEGSLPDALATIPPRYGSMYAPRVDFVGRTGGPGAFPERMTVRERVGHQRPKVAHRPHPAALVLRRGAHDVTASKSGDPIDSLRAWRRAAARAGGAPPPEEMPLVPAPCWPIRIMHVPVRSPDQYRRRVELLLEEHGGDGRLDRVAAALRDRSPEELYAEVALDEESIATGLAAGDLVEDTRLRDYLALCPDPLRAGPCLVAGPTAHPAELERERAETEFEAMAALARHARLTEIRLHRSRARLAVLSERIARRNTDRRSRLRFARRRRSVLRAKLLRARRELRAQRRRQVPRRRRFVRRLRSVRR